MNRTHARHAAICSDTRLAVAAQLLFSRAIRVGSLQLSRPGLTAAMTSKCNYGSVASAFPCQRAPSRAHDNIQAMQLDRCQTLPLPHEHTLDGRHTLQLPHEHTPRCTEYCACHLSTAISKVLRRAKRAPELRARQHPAQLDSCQIR